MDVESVVKCVLGKFKLAVIELVVADCLELLSHLFRVNLLCAKRCSTAHTLVGIARNVGSMSWEGNVPDPVSSIVFSDLFEDKMF